MLKRNNWKIINQPVSTVIHRVSTVKIRCPIIMIMSCTPYTTKYIYYMMLQHLIYLIGSNMRKLGWVATYWI